MASEIEQRIAALEDGLALLRAKSLLQGFELEALENALGALLPKWPDVPEPLATLAREKRSRILLKMKDLKPKFPSIHQQILELAPDLEE